MKIVMKKCLRRGKIFWETELIVTALVKALYNLLMYCGFNFSNCCPVTRIY